MTEETAKTKPNILMKRQEDQELRIYFFVGSKQIGVQFPTSKPVQAKTKVFYVAAFKLEEAFELAKIKGVDFNLLYTAQNPTVREFLHELELESLAYEALEGSRTLKVGQKELAKEEPVGIKIDLGPAQMSFEKFKAGLLFCANEKSIIYQNKEDRKTLKHIVSGLRHKA